MNHNEAVLILEETLDILIEVGNGVTHEMLHEQCDELFKFRDKYFNLNGKAMLALESLTPQGSEYVGDVKRCVEYIKDRFESNHRLIVKKIIENKNNKLKWTKEIPTTPGHYWTRFIHIDDNGKETICWTKTESYYLKDDLICEYDDYNLEDIPLITKTTSKYGRYEYSDKPIKEPEQCNT